MKKLLLAGALSALSTTVFAAEGAGAYIGAGVGQSNHDTGYDLSNEVGYKIFGGYMFNRWVGAEVGYARTSASGSTGSCADCYSINLKTTVDTVYVAAVGNLPLSQVVNLFAKAGLAANSAKATGSSGSANAEETVSKTDGMFGIGVDFNFTPSFAVGLEYDAFASDTGLGSLTAKFRF
jgi:OOP family OmpA-OmpF porin